MGTFYDGSVGDPHLDIRPFGRFLALFTALILFLVGATSAQTMLKDIRSGSGSSFPGGFAALGTNVYFAANDGVNGTELWVTDLTGGGTSLFADINPSGSSSPQNLFELNGKLLFSANDGTNGNELWITDGTGGGTSLLKDINSGGSSNPSNFLRIGAVMFFSADDGSTGIELWKTDGTTSGTQQVKDIESGATGSFPREFGAFQGLLFFQAFQSGSGSELWKSDGSSGGTVLVKDIWPGSSSSTPSKFTVLGDTLYFTASEGLYLENGGMELWRTNGNADSTFRVKEIRHGPQGSSPNWLTVFGDSLFFSAHEDTNGTELWVSDGTEAGTSLFANINAGLPSSLPANLVIFNGELFFTANDGSNGAELWKTDGTGGGTSMVRDIYSGSTGSSPSELVVVSNPSAKSAADELYFRASDATSGAELWKSDGTMGGTVMVGDIRAGSSGSFPGNLFAFSGQVLFAANDGTNGSELWMTDVTLPVELAALSARVDGRSVVLHWRTESEASNAGFDVQRRILRDQSTNAEAWQSVGFVVGGGDSAVPVDYQLRLDDLAPGRYAFRLRQVDVDGSYRYSQQIEVTIDYAESFVLEVYPNPAVREVTVEYRIPDGRSATISLYDVIGRRVRVLARTSEGNATSRIRTDLDGLAAGTYFVRIVGDGAVLQRPVVKVE